MNKKSLIILIVSISSFLILIAGVTYAYLKTTAIQSDSNIISTLNCLEVTMEDVSTPITVSETYPITDEEGLQTTPYRFKLKNLCNIQVGIDINLESLTTASSSGLYYYLKVSLNNDSPTLLRSKTSTTKYASGTDARRLMYASMNPNEERTYELRLWVDSDATYSQAGNKTYQGKIVAVAQPIYYQNKTSAPSEWSSAASNTLLAAIRDGKYTYANTLTIPGREHNSTYENVISSTPDDYGTSYYFRGIVENNYLVFANMCWRIVRVTGKANNNGDYNNAIKLVLYNYNPNSVSNPCAYSEDGSSKAFARYDNTTNGQAGKSMFSPQNTGNSNAYVGLMYGNPSGSTYEAVHANTTDNAILTNLKTWYDLVFTTAQKNVLADVIWCNDKSLATSTYNPDSWTGTINTGIGTTKTNYAARERLAASTATPSYVCPDATTNNASYKKISKYTGSETTFGNGALNGYKIGLLTADEMVFSGTRYSGNNYTYYLFKNTGINTWTLSPAVYNSNSNIVYIFTAGYLSNMTSYNPYGFRPAVALKATTTIVSGGDGSQLNPYVVSV